MKKYLSLLFALTLATFAQAQLAVTTNGGSGMAPTYTSLATAIADLNTKTINAPVIITCAAGSETAPSGGYVISAQGSAANTITIQGNGPANSVITAPVPAGPAGSLTDGIFKLVGADYITLRGFSMNENAANIVTTEAANTMVEWGVALVYASTTNGAQNNTIENNNITLLRSYQNTFGIYSNSTHSSSVVTSTATATSAAGANSGLKIFGNLISNVNTGIVCIGATAAANFNSGIDIGSPIASQGNTISNYGTTGTFSAFANVPQSVNGIVVRNTTGIRIINNSVSSSAGGSTAGILRAIFIPSFGAAPIGNAAVTIQSNTISITHGGTTNLFGISVETNTSNSISAININKNNFNSLASAVATSAVYTAISDSMAAYNTSISNNNFTNLTIASGTFNFIDHHFVASEGATVTVDSNSIVTGFNKTSTGGIINLVSNIYSSVNQSSYNYRGNNFSNITASGAAAITGIKFPASTGSSINCVGNILNNWTTGSGALIGFSIPNTGTGESHIRKNILSNLTSQGSQVTGILAPSNFATSSLLTIDSNYISNLSGGSNVSAINCSNNSLLVEIYGNDISGLTSTAASTSVTAIIVGDAYKTNVFSNKVYNISASGSTPLVTGLLISAGVTINVYNNLIGQLSAPSATNGTSDIIRGISITSFTADSYINLYNNTVYLNASGGPAFTTSALYHTYSATATTSALLMKNNVFVNTSTPGTGYAIAFRRSAATNLNNYAALSNNNDFYAGTPGANNLIFFDGTNKDQTIQAFKVRVASREQYSISENPPFISTSGTDATFLHIAATIATQLERGGVSVSLVPVDFDQEIRTDYPDIGADEFNGVALDQTGPEISFTALGNTATTSARTLAIKITDQAGVPVSGVGLPVLYWRINNGGYLSSPATSVSNSVYNFYFGAGVVTGDSVFYYIAAQDNQNNVSVSPGTGASNLSANPPSAIPGTFHFYKIVTGYSGNINVGTSETITSLTNTGGLFSLLNNSVLTGNVVVHIKSNLDAETGAIALNQLAQDGNFSLTIKPDGVYTITRTGFAGNYIRLNGADNITIDGSMNGSTSRDLTIYDPVGSGNFAVITVSSLGDRAGATNNTIKNLIIKGASSSLENYYGIFIGGSTVTTTGTGSDNDNVTIKNDSIISVGTAIYVAGIVTGKNDSVLIENNFLGNLAFGGISVSGASQCTITRNRIFNISNTSLNGSPYGIRIGKNSNNISITRNNISYVSTATSGYSGQGIQLLTDGLNCAVEVSNNMVSGMTGSPSALNVNFGAQATVALRVHSSVAASGFKIYHNSFNLYGNSSNSAAGSAAVVFIYQTISGIDFRNNIMSNSYSSNGISYLLYSPARKSSYTNLDFNDYYTANSATGYTGQIGYVDAKTFSEWQVVTSQEQNSLNVQPKFVSSSDLHLTPTLNAGLDKKGTYIPSVPLDIDGDSRDSIAPHMGADEFNGVYMFTGNGDWFVASNWLNNNIGPTNVPSNTEVIIDPSGVCNQTGSLSTQVSGKITVNNGKTLNLNGDLANAGSVVGGGVLNLSSGTSQLTSTGTLTTTLLLNSKKMSLNSDFSGGAIILTNKSRIQLNNFNLKMDTFALTGNDSNFIVTNGTGQVYRAVGTTPVVFPVGADSNSYSPVTITSTSAPGGFKVRVTPTVTAASRTTTAITSGHVNRTWVIIDSSAAGRSGTYKFQWDLADEQPGFNRNNAYVAQSHACQPPPNCTDIYYDIQARSAATGPANGPFSLIRSNITGPSTFIIKSSPDTSTFTGNGNWSDPNNWTPGLVPPTTITQSREVIINHVPNGECIIDGDIIIMPGGKLNLPANKKLTVKGKIIVQ